MNALGDKLAIALISPLGTAVSLGVAALVAGVGGGPGAALVLGLLAVLWLVVWSLPVVSQAVRSRLEALHAPVVLADVPTAAVMVVLGGGVAPAERPGGLPDLLIDADAVWQAARLFQAGKAPRVLLSGGRVASSSTTSEASAMQAFLLDLGVPEGAMLLEEQSRNTRQNAGLCARLLQPLGCTDILLVTSALHMARAKALFEAQGLHVTPVPTDPEARRRVPVLDWVPDTLALDGSARAFKEYVGRWTGR